MDFLTLYFEVYLSLRYIIQSYQVVSFIYLNLGNNHSINTVKYKLLPFTEVHKIAATLKFFGKNVERSLKNLYRK